MEYGSLVWYGYLNKTYTVNTTKSLFNSLPNTHKRAHTRMHTIITHWSQYEMNCTSVGICKVRTHTGSLTLVNVNIYCRLLTMTVTALSMTASHTASPLETGWLQQVFPLHSLPTSWWGATAVGGGRKSFHQDRQKLTLRMLQGTHHVPGRVGEQSSYLMDSRALQRYTHIVVVPLTYPKWAPVSQLPVFGNFASIQMYVCMCSRCASYAST